MAIDFKTFNSIVSHLIASRFPILFMRWVQEVGEVEERGGRWKELGPDGTRYRTLGKGTQRRKLM